MAMSEKEIEQIEKAAFDYFESIPGYHQGKTIDISSINAFLAGAKALDEMRKPTDSPNIKDYFETDATIDSVHNEIVSAPHLYAYAKALDSYIDGISVGKPDGDLVKRIVKIFDSYGVIYKGREIATEIAALMQNCENHEESRNISQTDKEWVDIRKQLPESGQCVLLHSISGGTSEGAYIESKGHFEQWRWNAILHDVTHWMPLPGFSNYEKQH